LPCGPNNTRLGAAQWPNSFGAKRAIGLIAKVKLAILELAIHAMENDREQFLQKIYF
jgi:hypothetical protein